MKKFLFLFLTALIILPATHASAVTKLAMGLKGRILLQAESKGQAWYVEPITFNRAYLGRPVDAFNIMRSFGLGITDANLAMIAEPGQGDINRAFARRFSGRILLQIQGHGEAWYVNPVDYKRYFLGRPVDAFKIMRELGLGITNANLAQIAIDSRFSEPAVTPPPVTPPASTTPPVSVPIIKIHNIYIQNFSFNPASVMINRGDVLVWTNKDSVGHTVSSATAPPGFGSVLLAQGQTYRFTFSEKGVYDYYCSPHPNMKGKIIVQ